MIKRTVMLCIFTLLSVFKGYGQVVDIERERNTDDSKALSGEVDIKGTYLDNVEVIYTFSLGGNIQYTSGQNVFLSIADIKITKSESVDFQDAAFLHFRYNRIITNLITLEAFTQIQDDKISKLKYRFLTGAGVRFTLTKDSKFRAFAGVLPMYEFEEIDDASSTINKAVRISQYLNMSLELSENSSVYTTTYFQPVWDGWSDARLHNETKLEFDITDKLNFNVTNTFSWDAEPPLGAPERKLELKLGLGYEF